MVKRGVRERGFTLIELITVVAIVGILAAVSLPNYRVAIIQAKDAVVGLLVSAVSQAAEPIKIGVIYPLTGGAAAEGRELRAGAELALEIQRGVSQHLDEHGARTRGSRALEGRRLS